MGTASQMRASDISWNTLATLTLLAVGGGVIGGFVHSEITQTVSAQTDSAKVIRAAAVELVDNAGNRVGFLGTDEKHNTSLTFFDARGKSRAAFSLDGGTEPRLQINGPDGGNLLTLGLGQSGKPQLIMSDHDFNGRVLLGIAEPDAPDPEWKYDTWVLRFAGDRLKTLATIAMRTGRSGGVVVRDQSGREWRTPLKE
jgi:hypothetical protein